jgi:hypothetical protein
MALRYGAYLVRVWQDSPHTPWRASAQSVQSGEKLLFADIEQLFVFLRTQCYPEGHQPPVDPPGSV